MEAIPINVIGKGGAFCTLDMPCQFVNSNPITLEAQTTLMPYFLFALATILVLTVSIHGIKWTYKKTQDNWQ